MLFVQYQNASDFEDVFHEAGNLSADAAREFLAGFPFEKQLAEIDDSGNFPCFPTLIFSREDGAFLRVQMQSKGEYILEVSQEDKTYDTFLNADFYDDPLEEVGQILIAFANGGFNEFEEWASDRFDYEQPEKESGPWHFSYEPDIRTWILPKELGVLSIVILFILCFLYVQSDMILLFIALLGAFFALPAYLLQWRFYREVHDVELEVNADEPSFTWQKGKDQKRKITRKDIASCRMLDLSNRHHNRFKLIITLKDGGVIKINHLLCNPWLILSALKLKYRFVGK